MRLVVGLLLSCGVIACAARDNRPEPGNRKTYEGLYLSGFEASIFLPEGVAEHWWLSGDVPPVPGSERKGLPGLGDALVMRIAVDGTVTDKGLWGHLGSGERELTVARILERKPATLDEFQLASCKLPSPEWATNEDLQTSDAYCAALKSRLK
ncbi:MAG: hypothetical protein B7Y90_13030 [Alphaproteobacteria bacterium 32-64-14]|nr:MAG: hypothetical protein B7Y90_13030 [Alphaproteobacteria bacterium 32-64-14]